MELLSQLPERVSAVEGQLIALRNDFVSLRVEIGSLRNEVREGDEETRRQMRVLHEDVIARIALLQETAWRLVPNSPR